MDNVTDPTSPTIGGGLHAEFTTERAAGVIVVGAVVFLIAVHGLFRGAMA